MYMFVTFVFAGPGKLSLFLSYCFNVPRILNIYGEFKTSEKPTSHFDNTFYTCVLSVWLVIQQEADEAVGVRTLAVQ